jgi:uncharacterized oxidoreductase
MLIPYETLQTLVAEIFIAQDCSPAESGRIAKYLVASNLTGHDSHGVIRVPRYVDYVQTGQVLRDRTIQTISESDTFAMVDGGYGFGQSVGLQGVELGMAKAKAHGVSIIGLKHSGHLGRIGEWAEIAADEGLASIHFVNVTGSEIVAPFGGVDRRFSTAPFAAGFPVLDRAPVILDFATSSVAEGKVLVAAKGGKPIPPESLIEPDGRMTNDPRTLYGSIEGTPNALHGKGAIRAFGGHKGSGLALMCELLAGALTGSGTAGPGERKFANGMLSIYMQPSAFGSREAFDHETQTYIDHFKACRPAEPGGEVLLPGEPEARTRAERMAKGVPLYDEVWAQLQRAAAEGGIDADAFLAAR